MQTQTQSSSLVDPTTKYYLQEKLKECHKVRTNIYLTIVNISVITFFICFVSFILYTIYINKPTEEEQREKNMINQDIIMNKIKEFRTVPAKITNLTDKYNGFML